MRVAPLLLILVALAGAPARAAEPPAEAQAIFVKALEAFQAKRYDEAIDGFEDYRHAVRETPARGGKLYVDAYFYAAEAHNLRGEKFEAHELYRHILSSHKTYARIAEIINREYEIGTAFIQGKAEKPWLGGLFDTKSEELGEEILRNLIENYQEKYFDSAQYEIAEYYYREHDWRRAADAYQRLEQSFARSPLADDSQYRRAQCYRRMSRGYDYDPSMILRAEEVLLDFVKKNPSGDRILDAETALAEIRAERARHYLDTARFYMFRERRPRAALIYLDAILRETPDAPAAAEVRPVLADVARKGDPQTARLAEQRIEAVDRRAQAAPPAAPPREGKLQDAAVPASGGGR